MNIADKLDEFTSRQGIISAEWCGLLNEVEKLEQELQATRKRLEKAEKVIEFYYNIRNWECGEVDPVDHEEIADRWNDLEWLGGKRARQYFKDREKKEII